MGRNFHRRNPHTYGIDFKRLVKAKGEGSVEILKDALISIGLRPGVRVRFSGYRSYDVDRKETGLGIHTDVKCPGCYEAVYLPTLECGGEDEGVCWRAAYTFDMAARKVKRAQAGLAGLNAMYADDPVTRAPSKIEQRRITQAFTLAAGTIAPGVIGRVAYIGKVVAVDLELGKPNLLRVKLSAWEAVNELEFAR